MKHRLTRIRKAMLDLLTKSRQPLSSPDIQATFLRKKISVNKTTIYRELAFLKAQNMVRQLQFVDHAKRYEIMPDNHHHHIVCVNCKKVGHVELAKDLDEAERSISKTMNFKIMNHSLEFFGLCRKCQ